MDGTQNIQLVLIAALAVFTLSLLYNVNFIQSCEALLPTKYPKSLMHVNKDFWEGGVAKP